MLSFEGKFRVTAAAGLVALAAALAGCQSSDKGIAGVDTTAPAPPDEKILQSELTAFCPSISVREGTAAYDSYAGGKTGDASQIAYQASIADTTRACKRSDGQMAIDVAVAGRIVPGPKVQGGAITLPIRVVVTSNGQVAFSQLFQHQVSVSDTTAATQFLFKTNAVVPAPQGRQGRIYVGFDEGPGKKDATGDEGEAGTDG